MSQSNNKVHCDRCDAVEYLGGEIDERTLEDAGWYLGVSEVLCPEHSEQINADFDFASTPHPRAYYEVNDETIDALGEDRDIYGIRGGNNG